MARHLSARQISSLHAGWRARLAYRHGALTVLALACSGNGGVGNAPGGGGGGAANGAGGEGAAGRIILTFSGAQTAPQSVPSLGAGALGLLAALMAWLAPGALRRRRGR